jgi:hypothetical protein
MNLPDRTNPAALTSCLVFLTAGFAFAQAPTFEVGRTTMMVEESVAASLFSVSAVINECTDFEQFALDWSDVSLKTWDAPEHSRQADMHLTITLGPSVMVGSTIVNSFSNVSGTLSIELEQKTT